MPFRLFKRKRSFIKAIEEGDIPTVKAYIAEYGAKGSLHDKLHSLIPPTSSLPLYLTNNAGHINFEMAILLLDAGTEPRFNNPHGCGPFEFAFGSADGYVFSMLLLWYEQDYADAKCSENRTMAQKIEHDEIYHRGIKAFFANTAADFRNAKSWLIEANTIADSGDYEAAAKKQEAIAAIYNKHVKYLKSCSYFNNIQPITQFFDEKRVASINDAISLYQKLLKKDIECISDSDKLRQSLLLEKLADLNLTLDKCEQAIDYSRRSAYLKCGVVAPINIEPSIIPAPHPDEIHIEDSNPLLSQPFRVSAENMHRRHPYSTTPNHI